MIYIIGIIITSFLTLILMGKKGKSPADRILVSWLCVILVHLILYSIISSNSYLKYPFLLGLELPIPLIHWPFLFLYTLSLTAKQVSRLKIIFHFLPFATALLSLIPFFLLSSEEKIYTYQNRGEGFEMNLAVIFIGILLSGITYTFLTIRALKRYKRQIKDNFSSIEKINLNWMYRLVIGLSCIWILVFFADDNTVFVSVVGFVLFIGYYGIKQVGVFTNSQAISFIPSGESKDASDPIMFPSESVKYEKSALSQSQLSTYHYDLNLVMTQKKLFLIPDLTLKMVADELNLHPNTLSQVINSVEQKNFFDYVNTLRIDEFKARVCMPGSQKFTLLTLAYECGFNSKTSFNRNFKNLTGKSPSEYLREIKAH
ncbi:MAG: AraC family transcriptional regulator [Bacteroidetes bacterium]|nr:MAG: AraC family transcriptional regulator [Bacteroidota bacterium]